MSVRIDAAWEDNRKLYGARKIWHVLRRQDEDAARCTVERLIRGLAIMGVVRGKKVITTNPDTSLPCPDDMVNRLFNADRPNKLWVDTPRVPGDALHGVERHYKIKLRSSGYHLVYRVEDRSVTVTVVAVGKRKRSEVYKAAAARTGKQ